MYTRAYEESNHFMSNFPLTILQGLALWIKKQNKNKKQQTIRLHMSSMEWDWEQ